MSSKKPLRISFLSSMGIDRCRSLAILHRINMSHAIGTSISDLLSNKIKKNEILDRPRKTVQNLVSITFCKFLQQSGRFRFPLTSLDPFRFKLILNSGGAEKQDSVSYLLLLRVIIKFQESIFLMRMKIKFLQLRQ